MKIVITQEEMNGIIQQALRDKFSLLMGAGQTISEIKGIGHSYGDIEVILEEKEQPIEVESEDVTDRD